TTEPDHDLEIGTGTYSEIDAGESTFTTGSSRTFKQNIKNVTLNQSILRQISKIPVTTYDFKPEICNVSDYDGKCTNKIGLIAEDFHQIFKRGDEKSLSGDEVKMALWLAIQEIQAENDQKNSEIQQLKQLICPDHPEAEICNS
ncbi:MAG: tail fiber domain-containing protein, partial [Candidatus Woesearchaeota archaeon]|nr:tail fiber domain-containing protein [Candidatus Woesearchaeota archaeon]